MYEPPSSRPLFSSFLILLNYYGSISKPRQSTFFSCKSLAVSGGFMTHESMCLDCSVGCGFRPSFQGPASAIALQHFPCTHWLVKLAANQLLLLCFKGLNEPRNFQCSERLLGLTGVSGSCDCFAHFRVGSSVMQSVSSQMASLRNCLIQISYMKIRGLSQLVAHLEAYYSSIR